MEISFLSILLIFSMLVFVQVFVVSLPCRVYVSISLLRNVEGGDPSPYASKKQRSVAPAILSWRI